MKSALNKRWKKKQKKIYQKYAKSSFGKLGRKRNSVGKYFILLNGRKTKYAALLTFLGDNKYITEEAVTLSDEIIRRTKKRFLILPHRKRFLKKFEVIVTQSFKQGYEKLCSEVSQKVKVTPIKIFSCQICNHKFTSKDLYDKHLESHNNTNKENDSASDGELVIDDDVIFLIDEDSGNNDQNSNEETLRLLKVEPTVGEFYCTKDGCQLKFTNEEDLVSHNGFYHKPKEKPFSCKLCSIRFSRESGLLAHQKISHPVEVKLPNEKIPIRRRESMFVPGTSNNGYNSKLNSTALFPGPSRRQSVFVSKAPLNVRKVDPPRRNSTANQQTNGNASTKRNIKFQSFHSPDKTTFDCSVCSAKFIKRNFLDRHMSIFHVAKKYICYHCNIPFALQLLLAHFKKYLSNNTQDFGYKKTMKNLEDVAAYQCAFCRYFSNDRKLTEDHMKNEHYEEYEKRSDSSGDDKNDSPDSLDCLLPKASSSSSEKEGNNIEIPEKTEQMTSLHYRCARCFQSFSNSQNLKEHSCKRYEQDHYNLASRNENDDSSEKNQNEDAHQSNNRLTIKSQMVNGFFNCIFCPKIFTDKTMCADHLLSAHSSHGTFH
ncbi:CLUMA_CG012466, isoform A [Clunio marinus]|uniref:CLUMA_CG012466, isoform A n=1 Tax=Clunio marinus TaxID=568069 RepID=A0A1J1IHB4_9DIPT|nr:CLUMA_CG012466, isoform A [Clunio marinus]